MGFTQDLFQEPVDSQNLFCPICYEVFDDSVQDHEDHLFCRLCIIKWVVTNYTCSLLDRKSLYPNELLLSKLHLKCSFEFCNTITSLDQYKLRQTLTKFNTASFLTKNNTLSWIIFARALTVKARANMIQLRVLFFVKKGCSMPISLPLPQSHNCIEKQKRVISKLTNLNRKGK